MAVGYLSAELNRGIAVPFTVLYAKKIIPMTNLQAGPVDEKTTQSDRSGGGSGRGGSNTPPSSGGGFLNNYKPEQGKGTRLGTLIAAGAMVIWGAVFLYDRLAVYQGDEAWRLLVTAGIPLLFCAVAGVAVYWVVFCQRSASDFMIATEGEMKKVNWSSRRELIGSTKVVILFTVLLALTLFLIDFVFQLFFQFIGVLRV